MFLFFGAKIRCFLLPRSGFPLKGWGKIPTSLFCACAVLYMIRYRTGEERKGLREVFRCFLEQSNEIFTTFALRKKQSDE